MKCPIKSLKNSFDFFLRNKLSFSRKNYFEENESKEGLFGGKCGGKCGALDRENFLIEKYDLNFLKSNSSVQNYLENLYLIDILDKYLQPKTKEELKILDIGCKNWYYASSEYAFFKKFCDKLQLDGIEIDANRMYTNFFTRKEVAKFYTNNLEGCTYIEGDFLKHNEKYDYIVWILPFVAEEPLLKWGLPLEHFKPEQMLKHAYESLNDGGTLLVFNQGEIEFDVQKGLYKKLNLSYTPIGEVKSEFFNYNIARYLTIANK